MPIPALRAATLACLLALAAPASPALAWGATGHRLIGELGEAALPADLPIFLRTPQAIEAVGEFAREPDRSKGSGRVHDTERDPGHFVDLDDDGKILGGPALAALPATRSDYETALRAVNTDSYHAGYLPYSIIDGWQQLVKDFTYVRVLEAAIPRETNPEHKAWMRRDLERRQALTLRDLGVWAHFVGDGSQPMHVTVHYNGWGPYPNPNGYTMDRIHAPFEGAFVRTNVGADQVRAAMAAEAPCADPIEVCAGRYLAATAATVEPLYALWKAGGFVGADPARGKAFAAARLAAGVDELRDLVVSAWAASANGSVGYPPITVDQVVKDHMDPYDALYGED
ncbi:MAG: S1/P1 Nuclease [Caulobacteraceae bacterium]|nr:S1/P1 Nuclease [Caulobacteraceae bacterium]